MADIQFFKNELPVNKGFQEQKVINIVVKSGKKW